MDYTVNKDQISDNSNGEFIKYTERKTKLIKYKEYLTF